MRSWIALMAVLGPLYAGCPTSHRSVSDSGLDASRLDAPRGPRDAPGDTPDVRVRTCVPTCTTDSECAASCPASPLGANCCDTVLGVCYAAMVAVCPISMPPDECPPTCASDLDCVHRCPTSPAGTFCCEGERCVATTTWACERHCVEACTTDAECTSSCPPILGAWRCAPGGVCEPAP